MAIFVNADTKVLVQGLTGGQGKYHGLRNRAYGTQIVAGVTPGKGGQDVEGVPIYDTVAEAVAATGADASFLAVHKAKGAGHDTRGAVLGSDAYFPFRDGVDQAVEAGITAIVQPGGSVRDDEVIAAADERGIAMVLTGKRLFRH